MLSVCFVLFPHRKRKRVIEEDDDTHYVKKPPNAFMLYRKEQRPIVLAENRNSDCAAVNTIIGQMVTIFETLCHTNVTSPSSVSDNTS